MSRLITFGCSLTYGHGLPDCIIDKNLPGSTASKLAWPSLMAEMMNRECVNMSEPGSSNDKIMHAIINFENFTREDHVIILWSFSHRGILFHSEKEKIDILSDGKNSLRTQLWELFYKVHTDYDLHFRTIKNMHHASCYFAAKQITVSNFYVDRNLQPIINSSDENTKNMIVEANLIDQQKIMVDIAVDRLHPGVNTHKKMADLIYKIHKEKHEH